METSVKISWEEIFSTPFEEAFEVDFDRVLDPAEREELNSISRGLLVAHVNRVLEDRCRAAVLRDDGDFDVYNEQAASDLRDKDSRVHGLILEAFLEAFL